MDKKPYSCSNMRQDANKNIFQIWRENGENLPFKVHRWTWPDERYAEISQIEIKKWPYGTAWGTIYWNGREYEKGVISCAGCFQWILAK